MRRGLGLAGRMPARTGKMPALPGERNSASPAVIFEAGLWPWATVYFTARSYWRARKPHIRKAMPMRIRKRESN